MNRIGSKLAACLLGAFLSGWASYTLGPVVVTLKTGRKVKAEACGIDRGMLILMMPDGGMWILSPGKYANVDGFCWS